jgi:hypothetical protein
VSLTFIEHNRLLTIEERQQKELNTLREIIRKQDRQIALLEGILRALESQKDIWGRSNADY